MTGAFCCVSTNVCGPCIGGTPPHASRIEDGHTATSSLSHIGPSRVAFHIERLPLLQRYPSQGPEPDEASPPCSNENIHHREVLQRHNNNKNNTMIAEFCTCTITCPRTRTRHTGMHISDVYEAPPAHPQGEDVCCNPDRPCQANNVRKFVLLVRGGSLEALLGGMPSLPLWVPRGSPFVLRFMGMVPPCDTGWPEFTSVTVMPPGADGPGTTADRKAWLRSSKQRPNKIKEPTHCTCMSLDEQSFGHRILCTGNAWAKRLSLGRIGPPKAATMMSLRGVMVGSTSETDTRAGGGQSATRPRQTAMDHGSRKAASTSRVCGGWQCRWLPRSHMLPPTMSHLLSGGKPPESSSGS